MRKDSSASGASAPVALARPTSAQNSVVSASGLEHGVRGMRRGDHEKAAAGRTGARIAVAVVLLWLLGAPACAAEKVPEAAIVRAHADRALARIRPRRP